MSEVGARTSSGDYAWTGLHKTLEVALIDQDPCEENLNFTVSIRVHTNDAEILGNRVMLLQKQSSIRSEIVLI